MATWDHKFVGVPIATDFEQIIALFKKLEAQGWEYVDHLDYEIPAPEIPADLRGRKEQPPAAGVHLLGQAAQAANNIIEVRYLIFKRPLPAAVPPAEAAA